MKGIIWARVSTEEQAHGFSLPGQLSDMRAAVAKRGNIEIVKEFSIDESARNADHRKAFRAMIDFRQKHNLDTIVIWDQDRLDRNYNDDTEVQNLIDRQHVNVFITSENKIINENSPPEERFFWRMKAAMAQLESDKIRKRTLMGMKTKLESGGIVWECPIGYKNVADQSDPTQRRRTVIIDEERAPLVRRGFELYATGRWTVSSLTDKLNHLGLRSKDGKRRAAHPVSRRCVEDLLKNRFYIGEFWDRKASLFRKHTYPTLIDSALFERVQRVLKAAQRRNYSRSEKERFYFKPFLRCYCGAAITAYAPRPTSIYYDCTQSHVKKDGRKVCADSIIYRESTIDAMFASALGRLYLNDRIAQRVRDSLNASAAADAAATKRYLKRLQAEQSRLTRHLQTCYQDHLDQRITPEEYTAHRERIQSELASITEQMEGLTAINLAWQEQGTTIIDLLRGFKVAYQNADIEGKAAILACVVDHVVLRGKGGADSEFFWKPPFDVLFFIGSSAFKSEGWGE